MRYEKPNLELVMAEEEDIITLSNGQNGDGDNIDNGPWN